jgi:hypothetical protein
LIGQGDSKVFRLFMKTKGTVARALSIEMVHGAMSTTELRNVNRVLKDPLKSTVNLDKFSRIVL